MLPAAKLPYIFCFFSNRKQSSLLLSKQKMPPKAAAFIL
jgi:hypothetical protein